MDIRNWAGRSKVLGTVICVGGALLLTLYKGNPLTKSHEVADTDSNKTMALTKKTENFTLGSMILLLSCVLWSLWFLMQSKIGRRYPCQYSSTTLLSAFGAIQSAILSLIIGRNPSAWILKGKLEIITVLYAVSEKNSQKARL